MQARLSNAAPQRTFALIPETGDEGAPSLEAFAADPGLTASRFTAIGAFEGVTSVTSTGRRRPTSRRDTRRGAARDGLRGIGARSLLEAARRRLTY
jgi:hypothetical protein